MFHILLPVKQVENAPLSSIDVPHTANTFFIFVVPKFFATEPGDLAHENNPAASGLLVLTKWAGVPNRLYGVTFSMVIEALGV